MCSSPVTSLVTASNHVSSSRQVRTGDKNDTGMEIANNSYYLAIHRTERLCYLLHKLLYILSTDVRVCRSSQHRIEHDRATFDAGSAIQQYGDARNSVARQHVGRITQDMQRVASVYNRTQSL